MSKSNKKVYQTYMGFKKLAAFNFTSILGSQFNFED